MNCADKVEEVVLAHDYPGEEWTVSMAIEAVNKRFNYPYAPSYMQEVMTRLSDNGPYRGHRSIFVRLGKDRFRLISSIVRKQKRKKKWKHDHLHFVDCVSVDEAYYHKLTEDAELLKKVRTVLRRKELDKTLMVSELRELVVGSDKPSVKLTRQGRAADLEKIRKPHRNVGPHAEQLTFQMKHALLTLAFHVAGNTARGLAHRGLVTEKKGQYVKTLLGEHVTVYLKMQGERA
jgi:hypothetical protein